MEKLAGTHKKERLKISFFHLIITKFVGEGAVYKIHLLCVARIQAVRLRVVDVFDMGNNFLPRGKKGNTSRSNRINT